ncbi:MAG: cupin domain-containing protein [Tenericutes bacterium]|nr:cupin domain-containing protein [Mycoplasmatota bacterium]
MIVGNINDVTAKVVNNPEAKDAFIKVLVSPKEGWDGYVMRELEVGAYGYTPKHSHPWPHINYIIEGVGELLIGEKVNRVKAGGFAYVPANETHQFRNVSGEVFKFICIVPEIGHSY